MEHYFRYSLYAEEKQGILKLVEFLENEIKTLSSGSCGDGSFDYKMRKSDIERYTNALKVINEVLQ